MKQQLNKRLSDYKGMMELHSALNLISCGTLQLKYFKKRVHCQKFNKIKLSQSLAATIARLRSCKLVSYYLLHNCSRDGLCMSRISFS